MSSPSTRIREARERLGLDRAAVARAAGLNDDWYADLERDDDEVTGNISLDQLIRIARTLGLTPLEILEGSDFPAASPRITLAELAKRSRARMIELGVPVEEYSQRVGWEMAPVFADARNLRAYTVDALRDICRDAGIDWHDAFPTTLDEAG